MVGQGFGPRDRRNSSSLVAEEISEARAEEETMVMEIWVPLLGREHQECGHFWWMIGNVGACDGIMHRDRACETTGSASPASSLLAVN